MGKLHTLISDQGIVERKDILGKTVTATSIMMSVALLVLGVLAIINP